MQQIVLTIEDRKIEQELDEVISHEGVNIQDFILQAIQSSLRQKIQKRERLDPWEHSEKISYTVNEDLSDAKPFSDVDNAADFGKELRKKSWKRSQL